MMTAKYIDLDGKELVTECQRVVAQKYSPLDKHPCKVTVIEPNGHTETYNKGKVYVMNDTGATISQWFVDQPE